MNPEQGVPQEQRYGYESKKRVNAVLESHEEPGSLFVHLSPEKKLKIRELKELVLEGLSLITKDIKSKEDIQKVEMVSEIVTKHPKLIEELGLTVSGPISKELQELYFKGAKGDVSHAEISKNDFLEEYLKEEK